SDFSGRRSTMVRLVAMLITMAGVTFGLPAHTPAPAGSDPEGLSFLELGQKDFDRVLPIKDGDMLIVKLPIQNPLLWTPLEKSPMRSVTPGFPKNGESKADPKPARPQLGKTILNVHSFRVTAGEEVTVQVKWMYCKMGKIDLTQQRINKGLIPPAPPFRPDL